MFNSNITLYIGSSYQILKEKKRVKTVVDLKEAEPVSVDFTFIFCPLNFCSVLRLFACIYISKFPLNSFEKNINSSLQPFS